MRLTIVRGRKRYSTHVLSFGPCAATIPDGFDGTVFGERRNSAPEPEFGRLQARVTID
jgi:hypothetical protein